METTVRPEARLVDIGDAALQVLVYEGDGPTLLFQHATGFLPWMWHPIARRLAGACRVVAPYFCDHRESDPTRGGIGWLQLADDLARLCAALGIERPLLVGHSMGATVLTLAEALYSLGSAGIIMIEPIFLPRDYYRRQWSIEDHPLARRSMYRRNSWTGPLEAKAYLKTKSLFRNWDEEMLDLYVRYGMKEGGAGNLELACPPEKEASIFLGDQQYDPWPVLEKITCPVLILEGGRSENAGIMDLQEAAGRMPNGIYRRIPDAGHLLPMEHPEKIVHLIGEFFSLDFR
ncbi:MAG: alpha/beta fold hydrolase [Desulfobacterales bacterium]